jgi:REP element-mobilizing transposase RayT
MKNIGVKSSFLKNIGVKSSFLTHYGQSAIRIQTIFSRWGKQISNKGSRMARALRITFPGAFNHITSRGNERKAVFKSIRDREKFLEYLESATQRYDALIHAYCMMDNHYHLLLETPSGNLSQIMRHINGAYTTYFNVKRGRFRTFISRAL